MKYFAFMKKRNFLKTSKMEVISRNPIAPWEAGRQRGNRNKNVKKYTVNI
ncbi:hypothetical protein [Lacrimispora brassicae]